MHINTKQWEYINNINTVGNTFLHVFLTDIMPEHVTQKYLVKFKFNFRN